MRPLEKVDRFEVWLDHAVNTVVGYLPRLLLALLVLWVGLRLVKLLVRGVDRGMAHREVEPTLRRFVGSLVGIGLKILLFVTAIQMMGVATTSFVAIIGAAGLAIGLALQGTLANFAGGVLVLLFRPYQVGDLVEAQGVTGHVKEIQIFTTVLLTPENRRVIIPNGAMANGMITNISAEGRLRVDLAITIGEAADVQLAKRVLGEMVARETLILTEPAPVIAVNRLVDDGVELTLQLWCRPEHRWDVQYAAYEQGREALIAARVPFPISDMEVYLRPSGPAAEKA
jgi:small conductance mechanosensitive channel